MQTTVENNTALTVIRTGIIDNTNGTLSADHQINLIGQRNSNEEHSTNKSSSASIGISFGSSGFVVNASASGSRGKGDGSDSDTTNTHVNATNQLAMTSGGDTTIKGATASGKQVTANIGGNLNIESQQDSSQYKSQQQSLGGSISVGAGKVSSSISASRSKVEGNYQSVTEQSGILAGDDGFKVTVNGNTDLKGAKIASTVKAVNDNKNSFTTSSLTTSDIQNKSDYKAESQSFSAGGGYGGGNSSLNGTGIGFGKDSGSASSTTTSGVSGIAGDKTVRSDKDNSNALKKTWNGKELQQDVEAQAKITETFGKQAALGIGTLATKKLDALNKQIDKETDPAKKVELQSEAKNWAEGGTYRTALHAAAGALGGGVAGALGATASAVSMPAIAEQINKLDVPNAVKQALAQVAAGVIGAAVGGSAGLASAVNVEANNRQLHQSERDFAKGKAKQYQQFLSEKTGEKITSEEAYQRLLSAGYGIVDSAAQTAGRSDETAKQFIAQNKTDDLFKATATERANPFLNGNKDGSWTPEQQARFGTRTPVENASKLVTQANDYLGKPCGTNCGSKFDAINDAVKALETAKPLYQDDAKSMALLNQQIAQLKLGITQDEIIRGAAQSISNTDKDIAFALLGGAVKPGLPAVAQSGTTKAVLLTELERNGTKLTPENVVAINKLADGKIVFLEQGDAKAGLQHIIERHGGEFVRKGIAQTDIPSVLMEALTQGKVVGRNGNAPVYEVVYNGSTRHIAIGVGSNGYIVRANPVSTWK